MTLRIAVLALAAAVTACGGRAPEASPSSNKPLGDQMSDTAWDSQVLAEASNAANEVVRNASDCAAANPTIVEARAKLDAAEPRVRTGTGRATLNALRQQVAKVADLCAGT